MTVYQITLVDYKREQVIETTVRNALTWQEAVMGALEKVPKAEYDIFVETKYLN